VSAAAALPIGGLIPFSTVDYPGALAAVVFCQGCPWRCGYCHNPHLRAARGAETLSWPSLAAWLRERQGLLDAVVFSGGDPTIHASLPAAMREVKDLGFRVGLHTGGVAPGRLRGVLSLVDWVGFDVKAPRRLYARITSDAGGAKRVWESLHALTTSGVAHELRTTVHPNLLSRDDGIELAAELSALQAREWTIQSFRAAGCADATLLAGKRSWSQADLDDAAAAFSGTTRLRSA
jgi:pyruvate formate lyase activating enzyme